MECLNCKTPMITHDYRGVEIDRCPMCNAYWFDQGELLEVLQLKRDSLMTDALRARLELPRTCRWCDTIYPMNVDHCDMCDRPLGHRCPRDTSEMMIVDESGVELDICPSCFGLWFDGNEFETLATLLVGEALTPDAPARRATIELTAISPDMTTSDSVVHGFDPEFAADPDRFGERALEVDLDVSADFEVDDGRSS